MTNSVPITSVEEMFDVFQQWHQHLMETLKHVENVPENVLPVIEGEDSELVLEGDTLKAFKAGLGIAISLVEHFPVVTTSNEEA